MSLAAPAFAGTYYIDYGDITITKNESGTQTITQAGKMEHEAEGEEIIITTTTAAITTLESDLEGPAAEDSGFGPVVEDNYQPADPAQPEGADQQKDADQQESADQQAQPQQSAPAASTPVNKKENGFWGNTITVLNDYANTVLNLTLKNVKIDASDRGPYAALSVQGDGNVTIELDGKNELKSGWGVAGLEKNTSEGTLTLKDDNKEAGSLKAEGGELAAGIGGSSYNGTNNITITGGTVNAIGGGGGAGIGGGGDVYGNGSHITITGGTVNAKGGISDTSIGGAGIGGGAGGNGDHIVITGGTVNATGSDSGAGIGGGMSGSGKNITITGGTVNAAGGESVAGIGGGLRGSGSNVTVSGAAQVTTTAGKGDNRFGAGATIGDGGKYSHTGDDVDGKEIQADISGLTTPGHIHHLSYNKEDDSYWEWWEYGHPQTAPAEDGSDTPLLHVETLKGAPLLFNTRQQGNTLRVTTDNLSARLHGTRQALEALQEQGVEQIVFVTTLKTTTLSVAELLAEGGSRFALEHDGPVSRLLSAAQAEKLKCQLQLH